LFFVTGFDQQIVDIREISETAERKKTLKEKHKWFIINISSNNYNTYSK
jgi:hypothetical protein